MAGGAYSPGIPPASLIDGRFDVVRLAARGGTSDVYEAVDRMLGGAVALKVLREQEEFWRERFELEAEALAQLSHPSIVRYVGHGVTTGGQEYLATEWLPGVTLRERLSRGKLSVSESLELIAWISEGLGQAHDRGIVHRDIKPGNIILSPDPAFPARLIDFGLIRRRSIPSRTLGGLILGTAGYMSPEQIRSASTVDPRSDVFSLGCVLFECLTGTAPFHSEDLIGMVGKVLFGDTPRVSDYDATLPDSVVALVGRMMAASPDNRPSNAREVATLIRGGRSCNIVLQDISSTGITDRERRILCVILAGEGRDHASQADVDQEAQTMASSLLPVGILDEMVAPYGGTVELLGKGLALVSLRGSPGNMDHAAHAARCALELRTQMALAPIVLVSGRSDPDAPLAVGEMFDRGAMMVRALASAPSTQVQSGIRIDEVTAGLVGSRFEIVGDSLGLLLRREVREQAGRPLLGRATPCVGRERELSFLTGLWAECLSEPRSRFATVTGSPGMGKSRLRLETCARIRVSHPAAQLWLAESDHRRAGSPLSTFRTMLVGALGLNLAENEDQRYDRIAARVSRHVASRDVPRVAAFLGEAAAIRPSREVMVELRAARSNPSLMGDQIERAWLDFVTSECRAQPILIMIDDAQWADEASLRLIAAAVRAQSDQPLLVVASGRPELSSVVEKLALGDALISEELHKLSTPACERLVRTVLPTLDAASSRRIGEIANGNPFFLEELIRAVASGKNPSDVETIVAIMQSRLEELPPSARRVLRAASVFGETFRVGGLRHLLGESVSDPSVEQDLQTLCERELVSRSDAGRGDLAFRHAIVRDASYSMLTDEDRKLAHRLAGEWLEENGEQDGWLLANHYVAAEEGDRAAEWFARAAEQASEVNDHHRASECAILGVQHAWSEQLRARLLVLQAEAARWLGSHDRAAEAAREAVSLLDAKSELWPRAVEEAVRALSRTGNAAEASALCSKLVDYGRAEARPIAVNVLFCRVALAMVAFGENPSTRELTELAEAAARRAPRRDALLDAHLAHARAVVALHGRLHFDQYASALEQTVAAFGVIGDLRGVAAQSVNLGYILTCMGALHAAVQTLQFAIETGEPRGLHHIVTAARHNLGHALALSGAHEHGLALERQAVTTFERQADRRLEGASRNYCARILTLMGRLEEAEYEARHAVSMLDAFPNTKAGAIATLAHVLAQRGEHAEVISLLRGAKLSASASTVEDDGTASVALATALIATGRSPEARGVIASACMVVAARASTIADRTMRGGYLLHAARAGEIARLALRMGILYPSVDDPI